MLVDECLLYRAVENENLEPVYYNQLPKDITMIGGKAFACKLRELLAKESSYSVE